MNFKEKFVLNRRNVLQTNQLGPLIWRPLLNTKYERIIQEVASFDMVCGCGLVMPMGHGGRADIPCLPLEQCMSRLQGKAVRATALASERCAWWCVSLLVGALKTSLYFNTVFFPLCHKASIVSDSGSVSLGHEIMTTWGSVRANFPWICSISCFKPLRFWGCLLLQLNPTYSEWYNINI